MRGWPEEIETTQGRMWMCSNSKSFRSILKEVCFSVVGRWWRWWRRGATGGLAGELGGRSVEERRYDDV